MNNKITLPELVDLVAQATNSSKRVSELFLKELFATITQALADGDSVRVKGLGTFKLTEVNPRKSVNVNTGETIEIPGHNKLSFIADKELADAVNTPFAQFDTVVLDDAVTDEALRAIDNGEPLPDDVPVAVESGDIATATDAKPAIEPQADDSAEAIDEPVADLATDEAAVTPPPFSPVEAEPLTEDIEPASTDEDKESESLAEPVVTPPPFVLDQPDETPVDATGSTDTESESETTEVAEPEQTAEAESEEELAEAAEPEQAAEAESEAETEADAELTESREATEETKAEPQPAHVGNSISGHHQSRLDYEEYITDDEIIALEKKAMFKGFIWGVLVGIILCAVAGYLWTTAVPDRKVEQAELVPDSVNSAATEVSKSDTAKADTSKVAKAAPEPKQQAEPAVVYETVTPSNVPARMARKHYGKECFWVYIYEENKGKIKNPNNIKEGTRLVIPPKEKYGIDRNDEQSVKKAQRLLYDLQKHDEKKD